jgi:hypothetical protein
VLRHALRSRHPFDLLAFTAALLLAGGGTARAADADTAGSLQSLIEANATVRTTSTGGTCVRVHAGAVNNPGSAPSCTISVPGPSADGRGNIRPKFFLQQGILEPNTDTFANTATTNSGGATTTSSGAADWVALLFPGLPTNFFGAWHGVSARVITTDAAVLNPGQAVGEARDPLEFIASSGAALAYTATLSDVRFRSDSTLGRNRLVVQSTFENVRRNNNPLTGQLWTLIVTSQGVVTSNAALTVDLSLWSGLGITPAQEAAAETFLRDQLQPLPNGYVGFSGEIELFGEDGPLPMLVLDHPANQVVRYIDSVTADTELGRPPAAVPGLRRSGALTLALLLLAMARMGLTSPHSWPRRNHRCQ